MSLWKLRELELQTNFVNNHFFCTLQACHSFSHIWITSSSCIYPELVVYTQSSNCCFISSLCWRWSCGLSGWDIAGCCVCSSQGEWTAIWEQWQLLATNCEYFFEFANQDLSHSNLDTVLQYDIAADYWCAQPTLQPMTIFPPFQIRRYDPCSLLEKKT